MDFKVLILTFHGLAISPNQRVSTGLVLTSNTDVKFNNQPQQPAAVTGKLGEENLILKLKTRSATNDKNLNIDQSN